MFNPNNDRLDYGQILAPPVGFELDFAVGTTYSLDLDALVGASMALGLSMDTDSALKENAVCLLEALRSTGDKVALFCEGGQIHLPGKVNALYILLEKMVFPVRTAKKRGMAAYPSFHPKCWLIRYVNNREHKKQYRFIVLSRNLTFDRSWDVSCYLDGFVGEAETQKNEPLCDFLRYLTDQIPRNGNGHAKVRLIRDLIRELSHVSFKTDQRVFFDFEFIPTGIRKESGGYYQFDQTPLFRDTFHEIVIMSPFVSNDVISKFNNRNDKSPIENCRYMLITRDMALKRLNPESVSNFELYVMKDKIIDGEETISEDVDNVKQQDIHAKVYMIRKGSRSDLYLGSLNATHNAVYGNVEFMLRLYSYRVNLNMDLLKSSLFGEKEEDSPFKQALPPEPSRKDEEKAGQPELIVKEICRSNPSAFVIGREDNTYDVAVRFGPVDLKGYSVTVRPLLAGKPQPFDTDLLFPGLGNLDLSRFYVVSVSDEESSIDRVIIIPTEGLPEDREKTVVTSVVSDRDCFYRYIAFLLGDDTVLSMLDSSPVQNSRGGSAGTQTTQIPALYEKMLRTAAVEPEKLNGIEYLMKTIGEDDIIPDDFKKLYDTIRKAVKMRG